MCDTNVFIHAGDGCPTRVTLFRAHPTVWSLALTTHRWCPGPEWGRWFPTGRSGHAYLLTTLGTRMVSPRQDRRQRIGGTSRPSVRSPAASFRSRPRTAKTGASMEPCSPDPHGGEGMLRSGPQLHRGGPTAHGTSGAINTSVLNFRKRKPIWRRRWETTQSWKCYQRTFLHESQ